MQNNKCEEIETFNHLKVKIPLKNRPNQEIIATFLRVVKPPFLIFSASSSRIKLLHENSVPGSLSRKKRIKSLGTRLHNNNTVRYIIVFDVCTFAIPFQFRPLFVSHLFTKST